MKKILCLSILFFCFFFIHTPSSSSSENKVLLFQLSGTIHTGTVKVLKELITQAKDENFECVIIELDTPGGLLDSTRSIVKLLLNNEIPIVVYVSPGGSRAGSAGTFITLAANIAAMAPGTNIGAAHPVFISGGDPEKSGGKHLAKKIENDTAAFIETIATQRGKNVEWAKKAVIKSASITENKALELGVIDLIAKNVADLLTNIDGMPYTVKDTKGVFHTKGATVVPFEMDLTLKITNTLASPSVIFFLILIVLLGVYLEVSYPGTFIPISVSGAALILLLVAVNIIPVNYFGFLLITLSLVFLILEPYVPSFGILTIAGITMFIIGNTILFDPKKVDLRIPLPNIIAAALSVGTFASFVAYKIIKTFKIKPITGTESMIGETVSIIRPIAKDNNGKVFVKGEYWNASSMDTLNPGDTGVILSVNGLLLDVKKAEETLIQS